MRAETPIGAPPNEVERALTKGTRKLAQREAQKEKAAQTLGRLLEDEDTARRAAHLFKSMVSED